MSAAVVAVAFALAGLIALAVVLGLRRGRSATVTPSSVARASGARLGELRERVQPIAGRARRSPSGRRRRTGPQLRPGELSERSQRIARRASALRSSRRRWRSTSPPAGPPSGLRFRGDPSDRTAVERGSSTNGRKPSERRVRDTAPEPAQNGNGHAAAKLSAYPEQVGARERSVAVSRLGAKVGLGCFYLGRLSDGSGAAWQYTAVDFASGYAWAEVHISERKPRARHMRDLVQRVRRELGAAGWRLESLTLDGSAQLPAREFRDEVERSGARWRDIDVGHPTSSNGPLDRLHQTILEECWRPASARSGPIALSAAQRDLDDYLETYNWRRTGSAGRTVDRAPGDILGAPRELASNGASAVARADGGEPEQHAEETATAQAEPLATSGPRGRERTG